MFQIRHQRPESGRSAPARAPLALDAEVPALVLRTDRNAFHHGTLGVIRSLGRAGVPVHAVLEGRRTPAARSRYLREAHPWLPPPRDVDALVAALGEVAKRIGQRALLVTVDDAGAIFAAEHADRLEPWFLLPRPDPELPRQVSDKERLARICAELGVAHPETRTPRSEAEVRQAVADLGLPLVAKWARPWLLEPGSGLRSTSLAHTLADALALFARMPQARGPLLLQRRLPYQPGGDWFFHGYFDGISRCVMGAAGRKERAYPPDAGLTTRGRWLDNQEVVRLGERIATGLGFRGILDLDFRRDAATGEYHLLDFNPRLGAQFRLFSDAGGLDQVRAMHLDLTGRATPPVRPSFGRELVVENYDLLSKLRQGRDRDRDRDRKRDGKRERDRAKDRAGPDRPAHDGRELAWFASDDLGPFVAMGAVWTARGFDRLGHRLRQRLGRRLRLDPASGHASHTTAGPALRPVGSAASTREDKPTDKPTEKFTGRQNRTETRT